MSNAPTAAEENEARVLTRRRQTRVDAALTVVIGGCAAIAFWLTWSGRYFHDGALLANQFDKGRYLHMHPAYLAMGEACYRTISILAEVPRELALKVSSVVAAALALMGAYCLSRLYDCRRSVAIGVATVIGVAPTFAFGARIVELHVLSGALTILATLVLFRLRGPLWIVFPLGLGIALAGHISSVALAPAFIAVLAAGRGATVRFTLRGAGVFLAVSVLAIAASGSLLRMSVGGGLLEFLPKLVAPLAGLADWSFFWRRLYEETWMAWGVVSLTPIAFLVARSWTAWHYAVAISFATILPIILASASIEGQYTLVLLPFYVVCTARLISRLSVSSIGRWVLVALLITHAGVSSKRWSELTYDADRRWAEDLPDVTNDRSVLLCDRTARTRLANMYSEFKAVRLPTYLRKPTIEFVRDATEQIGAARGDGMEVYFDLKVLQEWGRPTPEIDIARELKRQLQLTEVGTGVVRVVGTR